MLACDCPLVQSRVAFPSLLASFVIVITTVNVKYSIQGIHVNRSCFPSNPKGNWILIPLYTVDYWNPIFHSALHSRWRASSNQSWNLTSDVSNRIYFIYIFNTQKSQVGGTTLGGKPHCYWSPCFIFKLQINRCLNTTSWIQVVWYVLTQLSHQGLALCVLSKASTPLLHWLYAAWLPIVPLHIPFPMIGSICL